MKSLVQKQENLVSPLLQPDGQAIKVIEILIYEDLTYQLRGICYQTYNSLGPGFNEKLYRDVGF